MIKPGFTLDVIYERDMPAQDVRANEVVLAFGVMEHPAFLFIANPASDLLGIGKRGDLKFYDIDKLKEDGVYVNKRNYGGSGAFFGPRDVIYCLHVNKQTFVDEYRVDAADAFEFFTQQLCDMMNGMGVPSVMDNKSKRTREDGVCIHLQGRSEIVTEDGRKMIVSVYREDEMGFYINGAVLVSDSWHRIYDYLVSPMKVQLPQNSVEGLLGKEGITEEIIQSVIDTFGNSFDSTQNIEKTTLQNRAVDGIRYKYRVD